MKNLSQIIQGYIGMTPKDKGCENWTNMQSKMEEDINEFINSRPLSKEVKDALMGTLFIFGNYDENTMGKKLANECEKILNKI